MKLSKKSLKKIIKEELINEIGMGQNLYGDVHAGDDRSIEVVSSAIEHGNEIDERLRIAMRERAVRDFSSLYVNAIRDELRQFIEDNPGIESQDDLSPDKLREIKETSAKKALRRYKSSYTNTKLISDYTERVERIIGKPVPPTFRQLLIRYAKDFAYQFVFGFLDNVILILAGAAIDDYIKLVFGAEKLQRALSPDDLAFITDGIGNAISDGVGDVGGSAVEGAVDSWSWLDDAATDKQLEIATPFQKMMAKTATFTGVVLGCLAAIPVGILVLKGLTAMGISATAGMGATGSYLSGGLGLVASALMIKTAIDEFKMLDEAAQDTMNSALSVVMSRVYKKRKEAGIELPPRQQYTVDNFAGDVVDDRDIAQIIWNDEMDYSKLASHHDMNYNDVWITVDALSNRFGLDNPNRTRLDESNKDQLVYMIRHLIIAESGKKKKYRGYHPDESYEKGTVKNLMLDQPSSHGGWPEGEYDPKVNDRITKWLKDMEMI